MKLSDVQIGQTVRVCVTRRTLRNWSPDLVEFANCTGTVVDVDGGPFDEVALQCYGSRPVRFRASHLELISEAIPRQPEATKSSLTDPRYRALYDLLIENLQSELNLDSYMHGGDVEVNIVDVLEGAGFKVALTTNVTVT